LSDEARARLLRELTAAAEALAAGDLENAAFDVDDVGAVDPDLAELGRAFNHMLERVRDRRRVLEQRDVAFRTALNRLGDALTVTHDRAGIISAVLETSALTLAAERGVFYAVAGAGGGLRVLSSYGCDAEGVELPPGAGLAGDAARYDRVSVWPGPVPPTPDEGAENEPAVAVPLRRGNRAIGVLALYGRQGEGPFEDEELHLLGSLVHQAETAIENTFLYEEATRLSITDGLTGLWNRRLFDLRMSEELQRAVRFQEPFGLLLVDIDHFKAVNDRFGHQSGDAVLIELARRLTDATREVDVVTRFGGEEFALILPKTPGQGAMRLGAKVHDVVGSEPFTVGNEFIAVTVSVGVASYPEHGLSASDLLVAADGALYRAKEGGRDRVEEADPGGRGAPRGAGIGR
jgi:diguanylate cyclase (GGDEF)-like protein